MPLSIDMNMIDTEYESLNQIDPDIVQFYSEDVRTRVTGYAEPDEDGISEPITEEYTVIILNKPDEVTYDFVASRRARRLGEEVAKTALAQAIEWEEFDVNHNGYLNWIEEHQEWALVEPKLGDYPDQESFDRAHTLWVESEPVRPVVTLDARREVYEKIVQPYNSNTHYSEESDIIYDDIAYVATEVPILLDLPEDTIAAYHDDLAKAHVEEVLNSDLEVFGVEFQVRLVDRDKINEAINLGARNNLPDDTYRYWILADNSVRKTTLGELKQVMDAYTVRMDDLYLQYGTWRAGDKLTPFTYSPTNQQG